SSLARRCSSAHAAENGHRPRALYLPQRDRGHLSKGRFRRLLYESLPAACAYTTRGGERTAGLPAPARIREACAKLRRTHNFCLATMEARLESLPLDGMRSGTRERQFWDARMAKTRQKSDTKKRTAVKPLEERREASQAVSGATDEPARKRDGMFPIVGIGAPAGGIEAFKALLGALRDDAGMAYVFVLHLAPSHVSMLAQILARETRMPVTEVQDEPEVMPDRVYV